MEFVVSSCTVNGEWDKWHLCLPFLNYDPSKKYENNKVTKFLHAARKKRIALDKNFSRKASQFN